MIAFFIFGTGLICFGIGYYAGRKEEQKVSLPLLGKYKKVRKAVEEREYGNDIGK
ncbi:hypothetical protein [uncultured Dubosiella sp.]|uniref:hypothetical protein n=1 Tax=uncultured Dubosiella sp. TaxID=1937011 RepID=UPI0027319B0C|nr:hypothetical protein [uncultured Dubosiella sp.]